MTDTPNLARWMSEARKLQVQVKERSFSLPREVALREAVRAALFLKKRYQPVGKVPGLRNIQTLSLEKAEELLSIVRAVQEAELMLFLNEEEVTDGATELDPEAQARALLAAIDPALAHLLEGELTDEERHRIEKTRKLREEEKKGNESLSFVLLAFCETTKSVRHHLEALGDGFDISLLDQLEPLLYTLDNLPGEEERLKGRQRMSRRLLYQLLQLMQDRVSEIRKASAFVFRDFPKIHRQVTSAYERNRRAKNRKKNGETKKKK